MCCCPADCQVETPVPPPPLQQALLESDWQAHLAAEQAQQEAQAAAAEAAERAAQEAQAAADAAAAEAAEAAARAEQLQRVRTILDCNLMPPNTVWLLYWLPCRKRLVVSASLDTPSQTTSTAHCQSSMAPSAMWVHAGPRVNSRAVVG
jgi:hypothetical protein